MDLIKLFNESNNNIHKVIAKVNNDAFIKKEVITATSFLNENANTSQRLYSVLNHITEVPICPTCGNQVSFISFGKGYSKFCSPTCNLRSKAFIADRKSKVIDTCMARYGVDNAHKVKEVIEKTKTTCLEKYGVDSPLKSEPIKNKVKATNLEKYGKEWVTQTEMFKSKSKHTCVARYGVEYNMQRNSAVESFKNVCLSRYGVDNPSKVAKIRENAKNTCIKKYGAANVMRLSLFKNKVKNTCLYKYGTTSPLGNESIKRKILTTNNTRFYNSLFLNDRLRGLVTPMFTLSEFVGANVTYKFKCMKCGAVFEDTLYKGRIPRCGVCFPFVKSQYENNISNWLEEIGIKSVVRNTRKIIPPYELDIYLPDYNVAIEFDGLFFHSEIGGNKDRGYHLNKTNLCENAGITLLHIFEDEWIEKQDIVKNIILNKLKLITNKVYARKCTVDTVNYEEATSFLIANHLQGSAVGNKIFGLYYSTELVSIVVLSKPRFNKNYQYELIRSCSKVGVNVVGGFNKLIQHAVKVLDITSIISYVDKRYFTGSGYTAWSFLHDSQPSYSYIKDYKIRKSRLIFQKHKIATSEEDKNLTEWQLMQLGGYDRIWDCGNKVYEYKFNGIM